MSLADSLPPAIRFAAFMAACLIGVHSGLSQQMRGSPQLKSLEEEPSALVAIAESSGGVGEGAADSASSASRGNDGLENVQQVSGQAYGEIPSGVAYSSIFRDTGSPFYKLALPSKEQVKVGNSSEELSLRVPRLQLRGLDIPFLQRSFAPENAHLKLGPVYMRFGSLSGALIASDNINLTGSNRESGCIAAVRLGITVEAQLTEGFQLAVGGSVIYLPLVGKVGFDAGNRYYGFLMDLEYIPELASQLSYSAQIAGWNVLFADDVRVRRGTYLEGTRDDFYRFGSSEELYEDRAGRFAFYAPKKATSQGSIDINSIQRNSPNEDFTFLSNMLSVATSRLLPTEAQLNARAYREDLWYLNGGRNGLPTWRNVASVGVISERENLRFKPFSYYEVMKTSQMESGADQLIYAGVVGPISDQLSLLTRAGVAMGYQGRNDALWRIELSHEAGPYTTEWLVYSRELSDFHDSISQGFDYQLRQVLGRGLNATVFARLRSIESRTGDLGARDEFRSGLLLSYQLGPKTEMGLGGIYAGITGSEEGDKNETWTLRYDIAYHPTDSLTARLLYQYQKTDQSRGSSYYENLVFLTLTKTFQ